MNKKEITKSSESYFEGYSKGSKDTAKKIWKFAKNFFKYDEEGFIDELKKLVNDYEIEEEK